MPRTKGAKDTKPRDLIGREKTKVADDTHVYFPYTKYIIPYDNQEVSFQTKLKILGHPQVKAGWELTDAILANAEWWCEKATDEINEYVEWALKPLWDGIISASLMARAFGYSPFEKVFTFKNRDGKGQYLTYEKIKYLDPSTVELYVDGTGNYAGFGQQRYDVDRIPPEKTFWYVYAPHKAIYRHHPLFGWPVIDKDLYEVWYRDVIIWQMFARFLGKKVNPPTLGYAPQGNRRYKDKDGAWQQYNLMAELIDVISKINEGSGIVLPHEVDQHGNRAVDMKYLETQRTVGEYLQALNATEAQLFYGIIIPPSIFLTLTNTGRGSYAMMESVVDLYILMLKGTVGKKFRNQIGEQLITDLVKRQFGENAPIPELHIALETASLRKMLIDSLLLEQKKGTYSPDVPGFCRMAGLSPPARFDPEKPVLMKGGAGEKRVGGSQAPDRTGEEAGRVGDGIQDRKDARGTA